MKESSMTKPPQAVITEYLTGAWKSQAIYVAAYLGLADQLSAGPRSSEDLAQATNTHAPSLYRLLRALASIGIFHEVAPHRFALTPLAECLRGDRPDSQRSLALMNGEEHYRSWSELLYCIQTGRTAFEKIYGQPIFAYLAGNPRAAQIFDGAMVGVHGVETPAMIDAYDFSVYGTLVDVGGGNGSLMSAVLHRNAKLKGIVYDRPDVVERARPLLKSADLDARCQLLAGNFFESVPPGGDAYLMRHIIHDWNDEQSLTILANCRKVMPPHGKLLLVESVIPPGNEPFFGKFLDLTMLVLPGGQERTEEEYRILYQKAGFRLDRIVPTRSEVSVIEGVPV
jgi:O-methyltransferase domain/Dimerisation domain